MTHTQAFLKNELPAVAHRKWRKAVRTLFVFFVVVAAVWLVALLAAGAHVTSSLAHAQDEMLNAQADVQAFAFDSARASLQEAAFSLRTAKRLVPLLRSAAWAPVVGETISSLADVIERSEAIIVAFEPLMTLGSDMVRLSGLSEEYFEEVRAGLSPAVTFEDLPAQTKRSVLARLGAAADELHLLLARTGILQDEIALISSRRTFEPLMPVLEPLKAELARIQKPLAALARAATLLPAFAGLEEPSSILLLFLNNDELRPGGGFIGTYGILEMSNGDIARLETVDVYTLDDAAAAKVARTPPEPLQRYNAASKWFFRDSNWSPDFAVSSQQAVALFLEEAGMLNENSSVPVTDRIDHVIGFTPSFASELLTITGPVSVGGQTFTSENVADLLEYQVQYGFALEGKPTTQRKEILADLVNEMKSRLYALPAKEWPRVLQASENALQEKQLLLSSADESIQRVLARSGWIGEVKSQTVDTLMVVDANLASLKSDPVVARRVNYRVHRNASGQWIGRVSIRYAHMGTFDWKTTRYRTYTRVYLPLGSEFLAVEGAWQDDKTQNPGRITGSVDRVEELGLISFGAFTSVEPGEENTLTFDVALSPQVVSAIASGTYGLTLIKQPGAQNNPLTLELDFDKNVTRASPAEDSGEWGDDVYRLNTILDQDVRVDVRL